MTQLTQVVDMCETHCLVQTLVECESYAISGKVYCMTATDRQKTRTGTAAAGCDWLQPELSCYLAGHAWFLAKPDSDHDGVEHLVGPQSRQSAVPSVYLSLQYSSTCTACCTRTLHEYACKWVKAYCQ